jgi:signal transduction histidine kinase
MSRWLEERLGRHWLRDVALAVGLAAFEIAGSFGASRHEHRHRATDWLAVLLLAIATLALAGRARRPDLVLGVVFLATLAYIVIGYANGPNWPALVVAFLTAVAAGHRRLAWATIVVGWALFLWLQPLFGTGKAPTVLGAFALAAWLVVLLTVGELLRSRRERVAEARHTREEQARRRAGEERLLIARELHDVLAHNISLISVQAGVALHLMDDRPEQARTALEAIKQASGETLREMRSVLDILRGGDEGAPRTPTAGLARLDDVVARSAAAGLEVEVEVEGAPRPLPAGVDLAAFRIVQEALTNVTRHARAASATVHLTYGESDLVVQVDDDGRGPDGSPDGLGGGNGIPGMRERASALGGELDAGRRAGGGFRVRARLPVGSA